MTETQGFYGLTLFAALFPDEELQKHEISSVI